MCLATVYKESDDSVIFKNVSRIDVDGDNILIDKDDDNHNECRVGVNIGGGADFALTSSWIMNFELRYQLGSDFDQAVFIL